jgi:plasmid stability protein
MRRTQVQLDDETYAALRRRAYERGCSLAAVVRELLARALRGDQPRPQLRLEDLSFVAIGHSLQDPSAPVSERHDEALAEAVEEPRHPR